MMAGISGVELLTMKRAQGYRVPLISRPSDESFRGRVLKAGAIFFLVEPDPPFAVGQGRKPSLY
jgi:hypothetical protein